MNDNLQIDLMQRKNWSDLLVKVVFFTIFSSQVSRSICVVNLVNLGRILTKIEKLDRND